MVWLVLVAFPAVAVLAVIGLFVRLVVEGVADWRFMRKGCPKCRARKLKEIYGIPQYRTGGGQHNVEVNHEPESFLYLCGNCGARLKRWVEKYQWEDASGPEYEKHYHPETSVDDPKKVRKG